MENDTRSEEVWEYVKPPALAGVEILEAHNSAQELRVFNAAFSIAMLHTWRGEVQYKGRSWPTEPGMVFCTEPDEIHVASPYSTTGGSFHVFVVEGDILREYLAEHGTCSGSPRWRTPTHTPSPRLRQTLSTLFGMVPKHVTAMELQCALTDLIDATAGELIEQQRARSAHLAPPLTVAEKIRDCIHGDEPGLDLGMLARATGLSRFQVIRSFKQRYGLPPQVYQLHLKIARGQRLLRRGFSAAEVAAECGFVDQSHFGRHFKRLTGLTPGAYMRTSATQAAKHHLQWDDVPSIIRPTSSTRRCLACPPGAPDALAQTHPSANG